jgi:hypothetical protein
MNSEAAEKKKIMNHWKCWNDDLMVIMSPKQRLGDLMFLLRFFLLFFFFFFSFSKVGGNYPLDLKIIWSSGSS